MDLAQAALARRESAHEMLSDLAANFKLLRDEEAKIARAAQVLEGRIYAFEVRVKMARVEVYGPEMAARFDASSHASAPTAETGSGPADRLRKLQDLLDEGLLSHEEYEAKRAEIINSI